MDSEKDPNIITSPVEYESEIPIIEFPEYIFGIIKAHGDGVACVNSETGQYLTYNELINKTRLLAAGLQSKFNLKHGDNAAVVLSNCLEYPIMVLAIQLCGATAALINPLQTAGELKHSINLTNPKLWFGAEKIREKFDEVYANSVRPVLILLDGSTSDCLKLEDVIEEGKNKVFQPPVINPKEDIVFILFSSGTTGLPKAVALTHYNLVAARIQNREVTKGFPVQSDEVSMAILPFYHTFGISGIFENLLRSLRYVILPTFTMPKMLQTIQDFKITVLPIVPAIAVQLAKHPVEQHYDLSSLRIMFSGAASLSVEVANQLVEKFGCLVFQGYGMTEATLRTHSNILTFSREGSIGIVMPFCQSKIVDRETNKSLGPNQTGEICVRGALIMKGYVGNTSATNETIDAEGWLHTGDVGYYDTDGYFFITDRMKELIKYKGYQVSPTELEQILLTHPDVDDVAVAPVADEAAGELPRAYVVRKSASTATEEDIAAFLKGKVSAYKLLRGGVVFIAAVPKTHTGKIMRQKLKNLTSKL